MKIAALILSLFLASSALAAPKSVGERALEDACALSGYSCKGVEAPRVRVTSLPPNYQGLYPGGETVYLAGNPSTDSRAYAVLVHETVHYLQKVVDRTWPIESSIEMCLIEAEAFEVEAQVLARTGEVIGYDWRAAYGCAWDREVN